MRIQIIIIMRVVPNNIRRRQQKRNERNNNILYGIYNLQALPVYEMKMVVSVRP